MRRLFWVAVGAAGGVYAARQVSAARDRLTPEHAANRAAAQVGAAGGAARKFVADVRVATRRRDAELREALGIGDGGPSTGADAQAVADLLGQPGPADRAYLPPPPLATAPDAHHDADDDGRADHDRLPDRRGAR